MSLRRLLVLVKHLPETSATARALGGPGWTLHDYLTADLFASWAGKQHPADPRGKSRRAAPDQLAAGYQRSLDRRRRLGITGSVLRKGGAQG